MKKYHKILFLLILIGNFSFGLDLNDFSENKKIYLKDIMIIGNERMTQDEILEMIKLEKDNSFFVFEISSGLATLVSSGFFEDINYNILDEGSSDYTLAVYVKENPPLVSLKVLDSKMLDLSVFKKKLEANGIQTGLVFSTEALDKAIEQFNIFNQNYGIFLYNITYRIVTQEEIQTEAGNFLFDEQEKMQEGYHIIVYIKEISRLFISEIRMMDTKIAYDEILNYIKLRPGMLIKNDEELFFRFKRLKKMGFYDDIYFKLLQDKIAYKVIIYAKEIPLSEISTTLTAPSNIGLVTSVEYFNIGLMHTLQRFRMGAGWQINLGTPVFVLEYTHPYFWKGLFVDLTFSKNDQIDVFKDNENIKKLTNNYDVRLTTGVNVYGNFFSYVFHKERYAIVGAIDKSNSRIYEYNGLSYPKTKDFYHSSGLKLLYDNLDDNFFATQGAKVFLEYEVFWQEMMAHKFSFSGEIYIPIPLFNLISTVNNRTSFLVTKKGDSQTTLTLDTRTRTDVQEIQQLTNQQIKFTTYISPELRFPLPPIKGIVTDLSFILFAEAGGAWADVDLIKPEEVKYGFGIGFRLSPKRHYSSFLFQFPAGLYLGYRVGDKKLTSPTLISHRDEFYYINLTASF
ncbi:MAG TPA: hypothetical protein DHW82_04935 [Spirochaetia bacterium]|nr:MAG: hypothetical protein A2Y41_13230 [Spirochaetes bacterium GWB1_36_13]HCL56337.1 hypothetical protein [Spirochaetia bacterium]